MVWLLRSICSSSAFKSASPKISHHLPRATASLGCPVFQPVISLYESGTGSLKAGDATDVGRTYFGPTVQDAAMKTSAPVRNHFSKPLIAAALDESTAECTPDNWSK